MNIPQIRSLSIEDWHALSQEGISLPVTIRLHGQSMEPLIRCDLDAVTIIPCNRAPLPGDLVLFCRADGNYVVHRLYHSDPNGQWLLTWGDNCPRPDAPISPSAVLGFVISVEKDGRQICLDTDAQRKHGLAWLNSPIRRPLWQLTHRVRCWIAHHARIKTCTEKK